MTPFKYNVGEYVLGAKNTMHHDVPGVITNRRTNQAGEFLYDVHFGDLASGYPLYEALCFEYELDYPASTKRAAMATGALSFDLAPRVVLPTGVTSAIRSFSSNETPPTLVTTECDCGGFKTYKTMSPESHSHWCKSRISG